MCRWYVYLTEAYCPLISAHRWAWIIGIIALDHRLGCSSLGFCPCLIGWAGILDSEQVLSSLGTNLTAAPLIHHSWLNKLLFLGSRVEWFPHQSNETVFSPHWTIPFQIVYLWFPGGDSMTGGNSLDAGRRSKRRYKCWCIQCKVGAHVFLSGNRWKTSSWNRCAILQWHLFWEAKPIFV